MLERGCNSPAVQSRDPKPESTEKWSGVPTDAVSATSRFARSSAAATSGSPKPLPAISAAVKVTWISSSSCWRSRVSGNPSNRLRPRRNCAIASRTADLATDNLPARCQ